MIPKELKSLKYHIEDSKSEIRFEKDNFKTSTKRISANGSQKTGGKKSARSKPASYKSSKCLLLTLQKRREANTTLNLIPIMSTTCIKLLSTDEMS